MDWLAPALLGDPGARRRRRPRGGGGGRPLRPGRRRRPARHRRVAAARGRRAGPARARGRVARHGAARRAEGGPAAAPAARAAAALLLPAAGLRALRLSLLPDARPRHAARHAAAARARRGGARGGRAAGEAAARLARARAARGARLRAARGAPARVGAGARRGLRPRAQRRRRSPTSRGSSRRSRDSPLCARLAAARPVRREAGFAFALEPGGGGPLVSGFVDVLAREADGTALIVDYKTDRLERRGARRAGRARLPHAAHGLRARRPAGRRAARRGRLLPARAAGRAGARDVRARPTRPRSPTRCCGSPAGCSTSSGPWPPSRTATSAATARAARRCARGPRR